MCSKKYPKLILNKDLSTLRAYYLNMFPLHMRGEQRGCGISHIAELHYPKSQAIWELQFSSSRRQQVPFLLRGLICELFLFLKQDNIKRQPICSYNDAKDISYCYYKTRIIPIRFYGPKKQKINMGKQHCIW